MLTSRQKPESSKRAGWALIALIVLLLAAACGLQPSPVPTPTITPTPVPTSTLAPTPRPPIVLKTRLTAAERSAIFETVWQTVNDKYYDPTFGGKDWQAIGETYRQKLAAVQDDATFWFKLLNPMLFELGVSHLVALPSELASEIDRDVFLTGSLGMDVRLLDGRLVVTRIDQGASAAEGGLRPGYILTSLDGWTLEDIAANNLHAPPYNDRSLRTNFAGDMRGRFYGEAGKQVVVEYLDGNERPGSATLQFTPRSGEACGEIDPSLPPACAELEVKRLAGGTAYLRFSGFIGPVLDGVLQAIKDVHDAPALIIDLRGNPGGQFFVRKAIASQLVGEPKLFMRYQYRDSAEEAYLDPIPDPYPGKVAILVDELSASSSEEFSGSLQALGRATIVGVQTPGKCLTMNVVPMPNGAILLYPFGQGQTPAGRILEYNGVLPDVEVSLDRQQLLQGFDTQLEAALKFVAADE